MNYFLLAETEFFRRINEAGTAIWKKHTRLSPPKYRTVAAARTRTGPSSRLAYIEIELQHHPMRNLERKAK